jgi:hypothetical protein
MPPTVSRGYHTAAKWRTIAMVTEEELRTSAPRQFGAWIALEEFFLWVLEGLEKEPHQASPMAGVCALLIFTKVLTVQYRRVNLKLVERKAKKYFDLVAAIKEKKRTKVCDIQELRRFLVELARQGAP